MLNTEVGFIKAVVNSAAINTGVQCQCGMLTWNFGGEANTQECHLFALI